MMIRVLFFAILISTAASVNVFAQSNATDASKRASNERDNDAAPSDRMLEMQFRWRTRAAEKEFNEMVGRSEDVRETSESLKSAFASNKSLVAADLAKLPTLEKQLKKIRKALGGDDDDESSVEQNPASLGEALDQLAEAGAALNEDLKKSTRHQISVASIEDINRMLDLIVFVRAQTR